MFLAVALAAAGCLEGSLPTPSAVPSPTPTAPQASPSPAAHGRMLSIAVPDEPGELTPVATDEATTRVNALLYNALYRLDDRFVARPDLAARPPRVSPAGLTWTVALRSGVRFHDGTTLTADDVAFTYRLALSPNCPFGEERCESISARLRRVASDGRQMVTFTLRRPAAELLGTVLSRLAIVPEDATMRAVERLMDDAQDVDARAVTALSERIAAATNAEACLADPPPPRCSLRFYLTEVEEQLRAAGVPPPERARFTAVDGTLDADAFAGALVDQLGRLAAALAARDIDRVAAAYPLIELQRRPVGTGPYAFWSYVPGVGIELRRNEAYFARRIGPEGARVTVVREPGAAVTALQTGEVDWLPAVPPDEVAALQDDPALRIDRHPRPALLGVVFNVRPGRVYEDAPARRAFAACLDRTAAVRDATGGRGIVAVAPLHADSWAHVTPPLVPPSVRRARRILERAGWRLGADGIYARNGRRLSSDLFVRRSRGDQLALAMSASEQLRRCGIELRVEEVEAPGGALLEQIAWPNDFDTALHTRDLGADPDTDLSVFESTRITTESNPGDANFGGWSSPEADELLGRGRMERDVGRRRAIYAELQQLLADELPVYPLWYEVGYSALSRRVRSDRGIDLGRLRHDWAIDTWRLEGR